MGSKKKNKRERPSRREAERQEAAGKLAKKARHDSHDDQPFMSKRKDGAPPSSSKQMQQMQQKQQQQMRGAGAAGGKGGRPQQQQQQQQQQRAPKQPHPHRPAAGAAAAAASSSSAAASAKPAKAGKKSKQAVPVEEAEEAEPEADESEEPQEFGDDYNADTLDGLKIAFGASGTASGSASAAAAAPNAFRLADQSDSPTDPLRNKAGIEYDSGLTAQRFFEWMIFPLSLESFYENYFEQKPLFIARRDCSAFERQAAVTLVTTTKKLEGLLPREDEPLPWYAPGAGPVPKLTPTSIHDWKTEKNALKTEKVTVVEIESMASRVENREDGSLPAAADTATASSSSAAAAPPPTPGVLPHYYSDWFSIPDIHALLSDPTHNIHYRIDIDITRYKNGVRETLNPQGLATDAQVRTFLRQQDCSLRFLCPQKFSPKLWRMCNLLDEFFGMQVGANSYWTPRGTQGFAPHYDDVDIFVIQTEGCKRWRFYAPRSPGELLPSHSSPNFTQDEIGAPVMDVTVRAGDFLYAPRGTIHQCVAASEVDSLHVTLSTCLNTNWGTYFGIMLPRMLTLASEEHLEFRRSLPHKFERYMGVMHSDSGRSGAGQREEFMGQFMDLLTKMVESEDSLPFDAAADQMQTEFMHGRVPPMLLEAEKKRTVAGASSEPKQRKKLLRASTCIRLVKDGVARLTSSAKGDSISVHHILSNSRLYQENPLASLEFPVGYAPTIEAILRAYPKYVTLGSLPPPEPEEEDGEGEVSASAAEADLIELVESLFEEGLLEVTNDAASIEPDMIKTGETSDEESEPEGSADEQEDPEDDGDEDAYEGMGGEDDEEED